MLRLYKVNTSWRMDASSPYGLLTLVPSQYEIELWQRINNGKEEKVEAEEANQATKAKEDSKGGTTESK